MNTFYWAGAFACFGTSFTLYAQTSNTNQENTTIVTGKADDLLASVLESQEKVRLISGGASVLDAADWQGRITKPEEIFQFDPGVYARSSGTGNDTRLSVRGSGIQRRYGARGVNLLVDGAPINSADGSFYFRAISPFSISHIESYRGGNGLRYGSSQLGGSIEIHQKNGISHQGTELILEAGSYETYRTYLAHGGRKGAWDFHFGYSYAESDGYRNRQNWETHHLTANLGYHWSEDSVSRAYFLFNDSDALLAGSLTKKEFRENPQQSQANRHPDTDRDLSTIHFGVKTKWLTNSGEWNLNLGYQYLDFDHLTGLGNFTFNNLIDYDTDEFTLSLHGHHDYKLFNVDQRLYSHFSLVYGKNEVGGFSGFVRPGGQPAAINDREDTSKNLHYYLENDSKIGNHHLIAGLGYLVADRRRSLGKQDGRSEAFDFTQEGAVWKLGYLNEGTETQFFANASKSFEAAPFSEGASKGITNPQEAITFEIGTRYENDWFNAELSLYHAKVNEEFVYEETAPNSGIFAVTNADTTHAGIELATHTNINAALDLDSSLQFDFDFSYQLNDHTFDEGSIAGNTIPVISKHVIASRLSMAAEKWQTALSVDWLPDGLYADNANKLKTSGYAVVDWSAEWKMNQNTTLYGGVSNLFDKQYASTVTVNTANDSYINPGDGRSGYLGIKMTW